jgi:tetratricopeptide (TPR) repeat protein
VNKCRIQCTFLLVCVLITVPFDYGQTADAAVLTRAGLAEYRAGHFERAEILLRNALATALQNGDDYAAATAEVYLGDVYQNEDRLTEAEQVYSEALSLLRRIPNKSYEQALVLRNLGSVYSLNGRDSDAVKALQEASKLIKKDTRNEEALAAQVLNSLAMVYFRQGKTGKAETLLLRAITPADETAPTLGYAQILNNLGSVYQRRRKLDKAQKAFKQSLEITERELGASNVELAITLNNLASVYTEMRRYGDAEDLYRRAAVILEQTKPPLDAKIVRTLHALSKTYLRQGDTARAESVLARAVDVARRNPVCRGDLPTILEAYADVLKSRGQPELARRLRLEARQARAERGLTVRVPSR